MAINNFLPTIWSARLITALDRVNVFRALTNANYTTEAGNAERVRIGKLDTDITVRDYSKNTNINDPQVLDDSTQDLLLNQQKYFNFYVDDIDKVQSTPDILSEAMRKSAIAISAEIDGFVSNLMDDAITAANTDAKSTAFASVNDGYLPDIRSLRRQMKEANIASDIPIWMVVPPFFTEKLEEFILTGAGTGNAPFVPASAEGALTTGFRGNLMGINVFESNHCPTNGTNTRILLGTSDAVTFAQQIAEIEAFRPERRFGDGIKGLYVYGAKAVKPAELYALDVKTPV